MFQFSLDKFLNLSRIVAQSGTKWSQVNYSGEVDRLSGALEV
jgi:hypothetical protein